MIFHFLEFLNQILISDLFNNFKNNTKSYIYLLKCFLQQNRLTILKENFSNKFEMKINQQKNLYIPKEHLQNCRLFYLLPALDIDNLSYLRISKDPWINPVSYLMLRSFFKKNYLLDSINYRGKNP